FLAGNGRLNCGVRASAERFSSSAVSVRMNARARIASWVMLRHRSPTTEHMLAPERLLFGDDSRFPNSAYPALIYRGVLSEPAASRAAGFERLFSSHGWPAAWRNGLYAQHHYHSTAHEVLGVYEGWVQARLGGERGSVVLLRAGDVVVIPAGVAHRNEG